jgi:uncharacterized membrane protein (UPF0127 family)
MKSSKGYTFFLIFLLAITAGVLLALKIIGANVNKEPQIKFPNGVIYVEIAQTPETRNQGLSDRQSLGENRGMLFVFDKTGNYSFWMNKMNFNLDFVYFYDNQVVDIIKNVPYPKEGETPASVKSEKQFNKLLEINAGVADLLRIKVGDQATF